MKEKIFLLLIVLCSTKLCIAQSQEILDIAAQYPGENAVLKNNSEHLIFYFEEGKLVAKSEVKQEIVLLSDIALSIFNTSNIYHSSFHKLISMEGYSHVPNKKSYQTIKAGILKTTSSKNDNIFFDDDKVSVIGFSGLAKYAYTESNYTVEHTQLAFLPLFHFQSYIPSIENTFKMTVPKTVHIKTILKDIDSSMLETLVEENKNSITYTWTAKNMGRFKTYDNAPSIPVGMPRIIPYITDYTLPKTNKKIELISDKKSLYKFLYHFIANVNKESDTALQHKVSELTKNCKTDYCKAEEIYKWVQENIKYVAFEDSMGGFIPREAAAICQRKFGDCKDMTSLLVAMYRAAGLKAYFTWIGTRDKPYSYEDVPLPIVSNHMICSWKNEDKWIFVDGTHSSILLGVPPHHLQGKEAFISIDSNTFEIAKVPEIDAQNNILEDSTWVSISEQNELQGRVKISYFGYPAWDMKSVMKYNNENDRDKTIKSISIRGSNKYFQKSSTHEYIGDHVCFYSDFGVKDYIQKSGKEMYVNLNLLRYNSDQKVDNLEQRKVPIENKYKSITKQVVCLEIPAGYELSYLPEDASNKIEGVWGYDIKYRKIGNKVYCIKEYVESFLYLDKKLFVQHNQLVNELNSHYKESIILKAK